MSSAPIIERMQDHIRRWEETGDRRAVFLRCYSMMTENMLTAVARGEFQDPLWVNHLQVVQE